MTTWNDLFTGKVSWMDCFLNEILPLLVVAGTALWAGIEKGRAIETAEIEKTLLDKDRT